MMTDCKSCIHDEACQAWIRHGKTFYDDFEYSVENCPYYSPVVIPQRRVLSGYCPLCEHHLVLQFEEVADG